MEKLSIIIPLYNEENSIIHLIKELNSLRSKLSKREIEIIFVNDGSTDNTCKLLKDNQSNNQYRVINLTKNFGQTAAISAGIDSANGEILITMDGDLQNDPNDIPELLEKLNDGYDVVSGWRKKRNDKFFSRVLPSKIANWIISRISGVSLHDYGCTLKAYRKNILKDVKLYGEMHRFIPIYTSWQGGRVAEIPVNHFSRKYDKSKYGLSRTFIVIIDLVFLKYLEKHFYHPILLFGGFACLTFILSILSFMIMIYLKTIKKFYA